MERVFFLLFVGYIAKDFFIEMSVIMWLHHVACFVPAAFVYFTKIRGIGACECLICLMELGSLCYGLSVHTPNAFTVRACASPFGIPPAQPSPATPINRRRNVNCRTLSRRDLHVCLRTGHSPHRSQSQIPDCCYCAHLHLPPPSQAWLYPVGLTLRFVLLCGVACVCVRVRVCICACASEKIARPALRCGRGFLTLLMWFTRLVVGSCWRRAAAWGVVVCFRLVVDWLLLVACALYYVSTKHTPYIMRASIHTCAVQQRAGVLLPAPVRPDRRRQARHAACHLWRGDGAGFRSPRHGVRTHVGRRSRKGRDDDEE